MLALPVVFVVAALLIWALTFFNYLQDGRVSRFSIYMGFFTLFFAWFVYNLLKRRRDGRGE
jgi:Ca2+/Na+ antiporter